MGVRLAEQSSASNLTCREVGGSNLGNAYSFEKIEMECMSMSKTEQKVYKQNRANIYENVWRKSRCPDVGRYHHV
jgi:hypothetical protein